VRVLVAVVVALVLAGCSDDKPAAAPSTTSSTIRLAPSNVGPGTLQFRPVTGEGDDCAPVGDQNPPPEQPMTVLYTNQCLALGPSVLTVSHADVAAHQAFNRVVVGVRFRGTDVDGLARVSEQYTEKQVALVLFGRVLSVPQFHEVLTEGRAELSGLSARQAADLKAALA
jgi:preprotein translocase subunit SecD